MRGYNAETMLRLARADLAQPVALEQFLTRCIRASRERYETATAGPFIEGLLLVMGVLASIFWIASMISGGWSACGLFISLGGLGVLWLLYMAVADLRILRSVRRTRVGRCAICNYQIDAAPPPGAIAAIATCPECGEEVIVGGATDGLGTAGRAAAVIATPD